MNLRPKSYTRFALLLATSCVLVGASGCAPARLRADYKGFEGAYADTSNREMLLNLARLNQHDPTYFFKLGQVATSYRMQAAVGGNASYTTQGTTGHSVVGGVAPTFSYETNPAFTFIPVNDNTTAQLLLKPIPAELFYVLYQQGWRADQLFRLMVDRIEFRSAGSKDWQIIRNTPVENTADYATFLRVSALVYELQRRGYLLLRGRREFAALGEEFRAAPSVKDILDAQAKDLVWKKQDGQWELGTESITPLFELNPKNLTQQDVSDIVADMPELGTGGKGGVTALQEVLAILQNGFTIQESGTSAANGGASVTGRKLGAENGPIDVHLVMRSLIGMMAAAAQEQDGFDELMKTNPPVDAVHHFLDVVPRVERHPILRLTWSTGTVVVPPLVQLAYDGKIYMVTDRSELGAPSGVPGQGTDYSWNRDVFRLISLLTAQVTVDISKFPLPQILQLRTN